MASTMIDFCCKTSRPLWFRAFFSALAAVPCFASAAVPGLTSEMETMLAECAPNVHPETMAAVISAESRGNRFAIADAGPKHLPWSQRKSMVRSFYLPTVDDAIAKAQELISQGHTVSLGPAQINDRQLPRLGLSIEDVFDSCTNLRAGGQILGECYSRASKLHGPGHRALRAALSCYNSGDMARGEKEGYVDLVYSQRGKDLVLRTSGKAMSANTGNKAAGRQTMAASNQPWWKGAKPRAFTMSSQGFSVGVGE